MLRVILIIGAGGFIGSVLRFLTQQVLQKFFETNFPIGTTVVNIVGSFLIGVIYAFAEHDNFMNPEWRIFLAVGFCGGFTTFSAYALDNLHLLKDSGFLYLAIYMGGSVFVGLIAAYLGMQTHKLF